MTELLSLFSGIDFMNTFGLWMSLSIGAVALFVVFIPLVMWIDSRRKEREAFYRPDALRRIAEAPGEGAKAALELLRQEERLREIKKIEGMKVGGLVNLCAGIAVIIFLRFMFGGGSGSPYLCGLVIAATGLALLVYALFLAPNPQRERKN